MKSPFTGGLTRIVHEAATFKYRGQSFEVGAAQYECLDTQRRFTTTEQDEAFLEEVQRLYRERNFVPSPDEVKATRQQYGLSAARMSALLGFGTNQYSRYEAGEIPTESNGTLVWLASHPEVFGLLVKHKARLLRPRQFEQMQRRLAKLGVPTGGVRPRGTQLALPLMTVTYQQTVPAAYGHAAEKNLKNVAQRPVGQQVPGVKPVLLKAGEYSFEMAA
jgi:putative zinc finger/helix-turn-helix YgiT family protein